MKKSRKKLLVISLSTLFALFIVIPCIAIAVVKWAVLPPEKLTPIVLKYTRPLVNGTINCERVELTFWNSFPKVGLRLTDGQIISYTCRDSAAMANNQPAMSDTLLRFSRAMVTVDIMDYFRRNRVTVERMTIDRPFFYGLITEDGTANWDVLVETAEQQSADTSSSPIPVVDLKKMRIRHGHFIYEDRTAGLYAETAGFDLSMTNQLTRGNLKTEIKTGFSSLILDSPAYVLERDLAMQFESRVDLQRGRIGFLDAKLTVNEIPFSADGEVGFTDHKLLVDVNFATHVADIGELLGFVPDQYLRDRKKLSAKGSVRLEGSVKGAVAEDVPPEIRLSLNVDGFRLMSKDSKRGIEKLDTDLELYLSGEQPSASYATFTKLDMTGTNTSFRAKGRVTKLLTDPYISATLKGSVDVGAMMEDILNPDTITVRGVVEADIEAEFRLDELINGDLSRLNAAGTFTLDRMLVANRVEGASLFMKGVTFSADTTRRQSSFLSHDDLFGARLRVDTMSIRYGSDINTRLGGLDVQAKTSRSFDSTSVVPVTTHISVENLRARLPDSVWLSGKKIHVAGGIKASASDPKKGVFGGVVSLDTLRYVDAPARTRLIMDKSVFTLEILPMRDAVRQRSQMAAGGRADQTAASTVRPRRESGAVRRREAVGPAMRGDSAVRTGRQQDQARQQNRSILRNWQVRGSVKFDRLRAFSSMFPLPVRMDNTTLRFDTDKIDMTNARLRLGKSDFLLTGHLSGMRSTMMGRGVLKGSLSLESGYIDCNQLMRAITHSTLYSSDETAAVEEDLEQWDADELQEAEMAREEGIFVVPRNLDLVLQAKAGKIDYGELNLENVEGEIVVRNQSVNLRKLHMESNVGRGDLTLVYTAKDRSKASAGLELDLEGVIVEDFIGLFPQVDEMIPMLRSFEGVLDCQITATCQLDSAMNVVFPSLHSACYLSGENIVLMDGETFAEISKKLMFKNKERNLIDYISVDLLIKDNKVEIYPFKVEMDRYKLAVGGIHNLDMTFDYHVSVLKSPVPFKLGLDIKGDLDDFKFRIVKCRYKELFKVAREEELQQIRYNLRSGIREVISAQLMQNAPELGAKYTHERILSRRPEQAVTDMDEDPDEGTYVEDETENPEAGDSSEDPTVARARTDEEHPGDIVEATEDDPEPLGPDAPDQEGPADLI